MGSPAKPGRYLELGADRARAVSFAPANFAFFRFAQLRVDFVIRLAEVGLHCVGTGEFALTRLALRSVALVRIAPLRFALSRSAPVRVAPVSSRRGRSSGG